MATAQAEKQPLPLTQLSFYKLLFLPVRRKKKKNGADNIDQGGLLNLARINSFSIFE